MNKEGKKLKIGTSKTNEKEKEIEKEKYSIV